MRDLFDNELQFVSGACSAPTPPSGCGCSPSAPRRKGNNGFGQEKHGRQDPSLAAPGGSGSTPGNKEGSTVR